MMKSKLTECLLTCCIVLIVLTPSLLFYGLIWFNHLHVIHPAINPDVAIAPMPALLGEPYADLALTSIPDHSQPVASETCLLPTSSTTAEPSLVANRYSTLIHIAISILLLGCFLLPIIVHLGILLRHRYRLYQSAQLRKRVANLERLWQQSIQP